MVTRERNENMSAKNQLPEYLSLVQDLQSGDDVQIREKMDRFWEQLVPFFRDEPNAACQYVVKFATEAMQIPDGGDECPKSLNQAYLNLVQALSDPTDSAYIHHAYDDFTGKCINFYSQFSADASHRKVAQIQAYIKDHLDQNISLKELADTFYMNPSYLSRLFREKTGLTYSEYLAEVRIAQAKDLLSSTSESIVAVAHAVGYQEANSFSRFFKKETGMSPQKFRSQENASPERQGNAFIPCDDFDMGPCVMMNDDLDSADAFLNRK